MMPSAHSPTLVFIFKTWFLRTIIILKKEWRKKLRTTSHSTMSIKMILSTSVQHSTSKSSTMPWLSCKTGKRRRCSSSSTWTRKATRTLKCTRLWLSLPLMPHLSGRETSAVVRMFLLTSMLSIASWSTPSRLSSLYNKRSTWRTPKMTTLQWDVETSSLERVSLFSRVRTLPMMLLPKPRLALLGGLVRISVSSAAAREIFGRSRELLSPVMSIGKICKLVLLTDCADGFSLHLSPSFWLDALLQSSQLPSNIKKVSVMENINLSSTLVQKHFRSTSMNIKLWLFHMVSLLVSFLSIR